MASNDQQAFILRISPGGVDHVSEALENNQIIIGWALAEGLLNPNLEWERFREIISSTYYSEEPNLRRAGAAGGHMWRFIKDMKVGDFVVVPHSSGFYVAEVKGPASYNENERENDDVSFSLSFSL